MKNNKLIQYILPSVGGLCVAYLYNIIDGMFVGQGIGSLALAAVNISVPFITTLVALSSLFAMGGSTIIAISLGARDIKKANHIFMNSFLLVIILSLLLTLIGICFPYQIVIFCGSSQTLAPLAVEYLFYYTAFSIPSLLSNCLSVFVRNDGDPRLSFIGMCVGAISNIFLDWLFIYPFSMGLKGAAIASGLGQVLSCIILLSHFILKKGDLRISKFHVDISIMLEILKRGVPECLSQLNTPVTALCYNLVLTNTLGDNGIATYSILSFIYSLANAVLSGVAQGLQPLWGLSIGRSDKDEAEYLLKIGKKLNFILSIIIYVILIMFKVPVVSLFTSDSQVINSTTKALGMFALSFIVMAINLIYTSYFYSTKLTNKANIIALSRGVVVKAMVIILLPIILGINYIWFAMFIAEMITLIICLILNNKKLSI